MVGEKDGGVIPTWGFEEKGQQKHGGGSLNCGNRKWRGNKERQGGECKSWENNQKLKNHKGTNERSKMG